MLPIAPSPIMEIFLYVVSRDPFDSDFIAWALEQLPAAMSIPERFCCLEKKFLVLNVEC